MNTLELRIEQFIKDNSKVSVSTIIREFKGEVISQIRSTVSKLVIKNNWRVKHENGRLFVTSECASDLHKKATCMKHCGTLSITIVPKPIPIKGDWVVESNDEKCKSRLFFDEYYSRDEARSSFSKSEKVKFTTTRIKRYNPANTDFQKQN